jgi:hypothetical protein
MPAEIGQILLTAFVGLTLVGVAVAFIGRRQGAGIALAGLAGVAGVCIGALLRPDLVPLNLGAALEPDAAHWKERHDETQRRLRIAEENARVAETRVGRLQQAAEQVPKLLAEVAQLKSEIGKEKQAHVRTRQALTTEGEKAQIAAEEGRRKIAELESLGDKLSLDVKHLNEALAAERAAHGKTRVTLEADLARAERQVADVNRLMLALKVQRDQVEQERNGLVLDLLTANENWAVLDEALYDAQRTIRTLKGAQPPDASALAELRASLQSGIFGTHYDISIVLDAPTIVGRTGTYYAVKLRTPTAEGVFQFAIGRYLLTTSDALFVEAFDRLHEEVLSKLGRHVICELFVRGEADTREFKTAQLAAEHEEFRIVTYLPRDHSEMNRYLSSPKEQQLGEVWRNEHLPNLRAAYVARLIRERLHQLSVRSPCMGPTILQNLPAGAPRAISPELFLLIGWY